MVMGGLVVEPGAEGRPSVIAKDGAGGAGSSPGELRFPGAPPPP